jgi:hypothetical protein
VQAKSLIPWDKITGASLPRPLSDTANFPRFQKSLKNSQPLPMKKLLGKEMTRPEKQKSEQPSKLFPVSSDKRINSGCEPRTSGRRTEVETVKPGIVRNI